VQRILRNPKNENEQTTVATEWQIDPTPEAIMTAIEKEGKHYLQHTDVKIYFPYAYHNVAVISVRKTSFSFFGLHQWCV